MGTRAMQEATFLILTALADGSQHGYGIITDVQQISGGRVRLRAGTLYTALDRLRAEPGPGPARGVPGRLGGPRAAQPGPGEQPAPGMAGTPPHRLHRMVRLAR
ncbi:MAG TPA: helix-turn-helix transcriptional regulator [Streptosporangiaceae bacterium]|nr:helix-turn-helix transcriptional regulator [Streptosporangiaceae bacterium]